MEYNPFLPSQSNGRFSKSRLPGWFKATMFQNNNNERDEFGNQWSGNSWMDFLNMPQEGRNNIPPYHKRHFYDSHISNPHEEYRFPQYQSPPRRFRERGIHDSLVKCKSLSMNNLGSTMRECTCYGFGSNESWDSRFKTSLNIGDIVDMTQLFTLHSGRPIRDESGDYYNIGTSFRSGNNYYFMKYPANYVPGRDDSLDVEIIGMIPSRFSNHIGYFHTFGMTQKYLIFCEQPMAFDMDKMKHARRSHYSEYTKIMTGERNQFYIVDKITGRTMEITYVTDRPYNFSTFVNCYEENSHIIVDVQGYDSSERHSLYQGPTCCGHRSHCEYQMLRFRLPLQLEEKEIENHHLSTMREPRSLKKVALSPKYLFRETGWNHPTMNPSYRFKNYQYLYMTQSPLNGQLRGPYGNTVSKLDLESGRTIYWRTGDDSLYPSELMFVPNPHGRHEDDGIIMTRVSTYNHHDHGSFTVYINAQDMQEISRSMWEEESAPYSKPVVSKYFM